MKKHAYLIIAHHRFDILERLLRALDSENADFYIHIDRRAQNVDEAHILSCLKKSSGHIFRKFRITWGADTQVRCEMLLLREAAKAGYDYYHLLSGMDIPLKTAGEIERFFEARDASFLEVKKEMGSEETMDRVRLYYPLQNFIGRPRLDGGFMHGLLCQLSYELVKLQKLLRIDRTKNAPFVYCRGGNWFSITHELTAHLIKNESRIKRHFYHALNSDEMFVQCLACASDYPGKVVRDNLRLIDWARPEHGGCSPHTFTMADLPQLLESDKLWARKFDPGIDSEVIDVLYRRLDAQ